MGEQKPPKIPLGIRWVFWLEPVPKVLHRPIGCLVALILPVIGAAYFAALLLGLFQGLPEAAWRLLRWANVTPVRRALGVAALVAAGIVFYLLRRASRLLYAWVEITVAVTGMWLGIGSAVDSRAASLSLVMGGVYLLVRGFDNLSVGRQEAAERYSAKVMAALPEIVARSDALAAREARRAGEGAGSGGSDA